MFKFCTYRYTTFNYRYIKERLFRLRVLSGFCHIIVTYIRLNIEDSYKFDKAVYLTVPLCL